MTLTRYLSRRERDSMEIEIYVWLMVISIPVKKGFITFENESS
jgi:hypothetical protein